MYICLSFLKNLDSIERTARTARGAIDTSVRSTRKQKE